jgi:ABC-type Co2+ transport system permease subunit
MVTAELAACLPVLLVLLAVALSAVSVASARLQAQDAAREAALAAARAMPGSASRGPVPGGTSVTVTGDGALVRAVASVRARLLVPFLPAVTVTAVAVAAREPP